MLKTACILSATLAVCILPIGCTPEETEPYIPTNTIHEDAVVRVVSLPVDGEPATDYDAYLIIVKESGKVFISSGAPSVGVKELK